MTDFSLTCGCDILSLFKGGGTDQRGRLVWGATVVVCVRALTGYWEIFSTRGAILVPTALTHCKCLVASVVCRVPACTLLPDSVSFPLLVIHSSWEFCFHCHVSWHKLSIFSARFSPSTMHVLYQIFTIL